MKKSILFFTFFLLLGNGLSFGQTLFRTSVGEISFYSRTPALDIEALNKKAGAILNASTRELAIQMKITDFQFPNKLMQEHFNENYLESERYPTAKFSGKIKEEIDLSKPGTHPVTAGGNLTIHGVTKPVTVKGSIVVTATELKINFTFKVRTEDHQIKIPTLVFYKIAEVIEVSGKLNLVK
ncbi:MAG: YceI family protein [Bacteroidetes bacterium]|nr:YceI family protein [Bacteroidota bacterium]MDA1269132.1 YceI family protein [Bacteroidota bacterium]